MRSLYYGVLVGIFLSGYLLAKQDEASCTAFVGTKLDQQDSRVHVQINQGNYYQSSDVLTNIDFAYSYIQSKDNSFCQDRYDLTIHEVNQILKLSYAQIVTVLMALKLDNIRIAELWGLYKLGCYRNREVKKCQKDLQNQLNARDVKQREQTQKELQAREQDRKKAEHTKRLQLVYQEYLLDLSEQSSEYFQQRQIALNKTKNSNYRSYKQKRSLNEQIIGLCMAKGIDYKSLQDCAGTALQHQLYDEVVDCYKKIAKVLRQSGCSESILAGYSLEFAGQTVEATGLEAMQLAVALSDLSHICIDGVSSIVTGVSQGVTDFAEMVLDPVGTAKSLGHAFGKVMWYVAEAMQHADSESMGWKYYAEQLEQEHYFDGWYANQLANQCKVWCEQSSWQEKVQCFSKSVVDAVLCDKFTRLLLLTGGTCCSAIAGISEIRSLEAFADVFVESKVAVDFGEVRLKSLDDLGSSILKSEMKLDDKIICGIKNNKNLNYKKGANDVASNINSRIALNKKMKALHNAQQSAGKIKNLPDGRVRYYRSEKPAKKLGQTRGSSYVTEYNPSTGTVRSWQESYDHLGNVNRVHPKTLNGLDVVGQHYPPTGKEIEYWDKLKE